MDVPVRTFSRADDPEAAEAACDTMGKGFAADPNSELFCTDPGVYEWRWRAMASNLLLGSPHTPMLHTVGCGDLQHAAVAFAFSYPEQKAPEDGPELPPPESAAGFIDISPTDRPGSAPTRDEVLGYMGAKKAEFYQRRGPFEYIAFLATRPELTGRGLGSRLLRHLTDRADAAGRWCYLEATNPDNARVYARHGFVEVETRVWTEPALPGKRAMLILMERPPAVSG
ncbi:hypothetical protein HYH02_009309 [Chlamydomonas schloesseri]|uniref:N-acetyltransferase domain-containing protein n=1 Tax=Chlamydomonas schloesseri TaxID=2026947 RepID=A0A835TFN6_9CHLO|nr:hypothetical protein HYH02_009309 [Chlamydomonas schloesseri]|eukprot:KAG2443236.1 hypothetical protein HYH02_009309 [Chlamydomonas schloesseri]